LALKVKRSKVKVTGGGGILWRAAYRTACYPQKRWHVSI